MNQFVYKILPPSMYGGKSRAFLFEYIHHKDGVYGYAGQTVQHTRWMVEII
jgi:hypothetical protein